LGNSSSDFRKCVFATCRVCFLVLMTVGLQACVPKTEYLKVKSEMEALRQKSAVRQAPRLRDQSERIKACQQEKERLGFRAATCGRQLTDLQKRYRILEKKNRRASRQLDKLEADIQKREAVIYLQQRVIRTLDDSRRTIENSLKKKISAQGIRLENMQDRLREVLFEKIYFDAGSATLSEGAKSMLRKFAASIRHDSGVRIEVRGYSDDSPIGPVLKSRFASNWELSTARALAVVHFLQDQGRLNPEKLEACAFVGAGLTAAARKTGATKRESRRVEVIIHPLSHLPGLLPPAASPKPKTNTPGLRIKPGA